MKVEHAFLPKGELVLLVHVQSEKDRDDFQYILDWGQMRFSPHPEFMKPINQALNDAKGFFKEEKK